MCSGFVGLHRTGADLIDQELALAEALADDSVRGHALFNKCLHRWTYCLHQEAVVAAQDATRSLEAAGDLFTLAGVQGFQLLSLVCLGRLEDVRRIGRELEPLAMRLGNYPALLQHRRAEAMVRFFEEGDPAELVAFGDADRERCRQSGLPWVNMSLAWSGTGEFLRGDWEAARRRLEEGERLEPPTGAVKGWSTGPLFECLAHLGRRSEALALLDGGRPQLPRLGEVSGWGPLTLLLSAVEGLVALGERSRAGSLYSVVLESMTRTGSVCGSLFDGRLQSRVAGLAAMAAGRWAAAENHFTAAIEQAEAIPHRPEAAHTRRQFGMMLLERSRPADRRRGATLVADALEAYRRMGMRGHADLTESLLTS
jgi:hypothetical protein